MSPHPRHRSALRQLDDLISNVARPLKYAQQPFLRLMLAIRANSRILTPPEQLDRARLATRPSASGRDPRRLDQPTSAPPAIARFYGWRHPEQVVTACLRMANLHHLWHRPPEDWQASEGSPFVQFRALVNHLFARFPVPNFLVSAWWGPECELWLVDLYLHIAAGRGLRQFSQLDWKKLPGFARISRDLPRSLVLRVPLPFLQITKSIASHWMTAPDDLHPTTALRWAQVRSLGGDARLARLLCSCIPQTEPQHEPFWESTIRFLVDNQPISDEELIEIMRFLREQRFQPACDVAGPARGTEPLQPNLTLAGRTLMSLRRHMNNWRTDLRIEPEYLLPDRDRWHTSGIRPFEGATSEGLWTIEEILTWKDLHLEGTTMHHCATSYRMACVRRQASIWSMKLRQNGHQRRMLTIEVIPLTRTIHQVKGDFNAPPTPPGIAILQRWASQEGLNF